MDQQNSLVITETAAVVRRLLTIVDELDRANPEDGVEIFPIRHAKASELMEPLKALLSTRIEKYKSTADAQPLRPPGAVANLPRFITNQIPADLTVGSSTDASEAYVGAWPES